MQVGLHDLLRLAPSQPASHAWIAGTLIPWLSNSTNLTNSSFYPLKACLLELFNNIQDHTQFDILSIFGQHFPNKKKIVISVADFGAGIPSVVRTKCHAASDVQTIILAVKENFTTKSNTNNMGVGLSYVLDVICKTFKGALAIYSGSAIVRFAALNDQIVPTAAKVAGFCPERRSKSS